MAASPAADAATVAVERGLRREGGGRGLEIGFQAVLIACILISLGTLVVLLVDVLAEGLGSLSPSFITDVPSRVIPESSGIGPALAGTLWLMAVCAAFIIPVGVATAVYLEEYANPERRINRSIEVNIQNLAAVPSIIYGILGLAFFVRGPFDLGFVVAAGSLTLALLVLPTVILAAREAIRAVPPSIREGSLALGATQWQTIRRQLLPASIPGIATGVILAVSRALGEAAPLLLVGAATFVTADQPNPFEGGYSAMPVQIFNYALDPQEEFRTLAAAGVVVMLVVLLAMNSFAIWLRNRYEQQW
jgi:phosphate transport system permease protein